MKLHPSGVWSVCEITENKLILTRVIHYCKGHNVFWVIDKLSELIITHVSHGNALVRLMLRIDTHQTP